MKILLSFQDLIDLPLYEQVYIVSSGGERSYQKAGYRSEKKDVVVLSSNLNVKTAIGITNAEFGPKNTIFLAGSYDSKFVGELMLELLEKEIETINHVYLCKENYS